MTKSNKISYIFNEIIKVKLKDESRITYEEINDVDLTLPGRVFLNDLTNNSPNFGLKMLTKRDLILIWNKISIKHSSFKYIDCNVQVIKGSSDVIIDIIKKTLKHELYINDTNNHPDWWHDDW